MQPTWYRGFSCSGNEAIALVANGDRVRGPDAVWVADPDQEPRRAPLVAAFAVLESGVRGNPDRALRLQLRAIESRLVDAAGLLADLRRDDPRHVLRPHMPGLRLGAVR